MKNELKSTVIRLLHPGRVQHGVKSSKKLTVWTADDNIVYFGFDLCQAKYRF